jgi:predicted transcriptional regulator
MLQLQRAGLTESEIEGMRRGEIPKGYQVHHKLSLCRWMTRAPTISITLYL